MAQNFKHNKKRDTGLVYEFLIRRLSQTMLDGDKDGQRTALGIVRKYFDQSSGPLSEERELFDVIRNTRGVSENVARQVLSEVQKAARKMDVKKLDIKKSNLIKEINYSFGQDFWDNHRIPDYRVLASIQMVIDASRGDANLTESVSKIQLEEGLVQFMMTKSGAVLAQPSKSEVDQLVMRMVAKRFEEKYSKTLSTPQKKLLEKYVRYQVSGDDKQLSDFLLDEMVRISKSLDAALAMNEFTEDKFMLEKLVEAKKLFPTVGNKPVDYRVEEVMMYQKLVEEIESND